MTLDEAINEYRNRFTGLKDVCEECSNECKQMYLWLMELKELRETMKRSEYVK